MDQDLSNPKAVADAGERIYAERYKQGYEANYRGWFVLIDVRSAIAYLGPTPQAAIHEARQKAPNGIFHLIRVGEPGAFHVSSRRNAAPDWHARQ
jgi:hypothetical protein